MNRRDTLKLLAAGTLGATLPGCGPAEVERAAIAAAAEPDGSFEDYGLRFFSRPEYETVRVLVDMIIPADERSGSATDARVPEFIDFMASDVEDLQTKVRGGLAWLNYRSMRDAGAPFVDASPAQRTALVEAIAWPEQAADDDRAGVVFFNLMRDLTATGFFSSRMGIADVDYQGNVARPAWDGCGEEAMRHIGEV